MSGNISAPLHFFWYWVFEFWLAVTITTTLSFVDDILIVGDASRSMSSNMSLPWRVVWTIGLLCIFTFTLTLFRAVHLHLDQPRCILIPGGNHLNVIHRGTCLNLKSEKWKSTVFTPKGFTLSHRKHCSCTAWKHLIWSWTFTFVTLCASPCNRLHILSLPVS